MNFVVYPDSAIARLPRALRLPALLVRNVLVLLRAIPPPGRPARVAKPRYVYEADGLATMHFSPFLEDEEWSALYDEMAAEWFTHGPVDVRWRMWLLTCLARSCSTLGGNSAEFGVYRAGCAFMIMSAGALPAPKRLFLFDTFSGIPTDALTEQEVVVGLAGELADTSTGYVRRRLVRWEAQVTLVEGDVFETLKEVETGPLSFVHMDLNASAPTRVALEYAYPRMVDGAIIVFDDYGGNYDGKSLVDQRIVVDSYAAQQGQAVIALPSGQGMLIKRA